MRYPGKRMTAKKLGAVIDRIPHEVYVEPMVGMGTVFFAKKPSRIEVLSDLDCKVTREMKKQACSLKDKTKCNRLKDAIITCGKDYREIIKKYDSKKTLIYLDPPYEGTKCEYNHCDIPTSEIVNVMKKAKGTVLMSNTPLNRKEICGGKIKRRTIPFKFWGQPRADILAIKR